MKDLLIEWRRLVEGGDTCERCATTGKTLEKLILEFTPLLNVNGVKPIFKEVALSGAEIEQSNAVFLNGVPMEELVAGVKVSENSCSSCSDLLGEQTCCRAIEYEEQTFDEIPEFLLRAAILKAAERLIDKG